MMKKNPFHILGLNQDIIRALGNDPQIQILLDSQLKALQRIYHPDVQGGDAEKSRMLNEARALLDPSKNNELYEHYKKSFLKSSRQKKEDGKVLGDEYDKNYLALAETFLRYLLEFSAKPEKLSVFNLKPAALLVFDTMISENLDSYQREELRKLRGAHYLNYELIIMPEGKLQKIKDGREINLPFKKIIGTMDERTVNNAGGINRILNMTVPAEIPQIQHALPRQNQYYKKRKPESRIYAEGFRNIMHLLSPEINENSYLFSINQFPGESFFTLDGRIMQINES